MVRLAAKDLQAILELTLAARGCERLDSFCEQVVPGIRALVPFDWYGYNEIDLRNGISTAITDAPVFPGIDERFLEVAHEHPAVARQQAGDLRTWAISDFLSARHFHRLELYADLYRLLGTEDLIAFGFPARIIVGIGLSRARRSYTERDRQVLELLRPHLAQAYGQITERERAAATIAMLDRGLEEQHAAVIALDRHGRIAHLSASAAHLVAAYLPMDAGTACRLPPVLDAWAQAASDGEELVVAGPQGRLRVRMHAVADSPVWRALVMSETRSGPPDLKPLQALGLTRRQAEVLALLTIGKTNQQIANQLSLSVATVRKHLEHIYARLGVSSRSEAIARTLA